MNASLLDIIKGIKKNNRIVEGFRSFIVIAAAVGVILNVAVVNADPPQPSTTPGWYHHFLGNGDCQERYFEEGQKPNPEWEEGLCPIPEVTETPESITETPDPTENPTEPPSTRTPVPTEEHKATRTPDPTEIPTEPPSTRTPDPTSAETDVPGGDCEEDCEEIEETATPTPTPTVGPGTVFTVTQVVTTPVPAITSTVQVFSSPTPTSTSTPTQTPTVVPGHKPQVQGDKWYLDGGLGLNVFLPAIFKDWGQLVAGLCGAILIPLLVLAVLLARRRKKGETGISAS
ncbi:hypothetical protein A2899_01005 [Candidatus Amesbacteria bacterium RIFCSPLOWO2_01_FULL_49_25]|uniref:Uncharacterized protein n=1 Tax=Candidatus Amesbacteria bacterium RIFCSPHIGHO2_01_FULL_48_32b TaxID=1797253 RepID=A0A1F4YFM0_9BACT|nr:MAG: hypothetical protein A2876_00155 [Candidatus Amesbacteria bacterium RIFCSPHIGHO2_01_FULL_48_32b]OGD07142.1 MAG: hypothetical protein A2899_01005 [Candidatus Amesbacteria bacterium RIFCSPLOWO2_01_FULL_49_25]